MKNNKSNIVTKDPIFLPVGETDYELFIPWKKSFEGNCFFKWVFESFIEFNDLNIQNDKNIYFFKNESTFALRINTEMLELSSNIVWNYWKDEILDCGYILKNSALLAKSGQTILRYYLKPKLVFKVEGQQLFGNITLEIIKKDAIPKFIMMKCTWYNDNNFKTPRPYKELMKILTN